MFGQHACWYRVLSCTREKGENSMSSDKRKEFVIVSVEHGIGGRFIFSLRDGEACGSMPPVDIIVHGEALPPVRSGIVHFTGHRVRIMGEFCGGHGFIVGGSFDPSSDRGRIEIEIEVEPITDTSVAV